MYFQLAFITKKKIRVEQHMLYVIQAIYFIEVVYRDYNFKKSLNLLKLYVDYGFIYNSEAEHNRVLLLVYIVLI